MGNDSQPHPSGGIDYRQLFDLAPDAYLVSDTNGWLLCANAEAAGLLGVHLDDLVDLSIFEFFSPGGEADALERLSRLEPDSVEEWSVQLLARSRDPITVAIRLRSSPAEGALPATLRWQLRDVSESERALEALRESEMRLQALNDLKDTFLRSVSHDLRGPLAAVIGLAQTLVREDLDLGQGDVADLLKRILKSSHQMKALLTDLLDLDRLSEGYLAMEEEVVDLDELGRQVSGQLDPERQQGVEVMPSGLAVRVDRAVLERIMVNLLDNALRYTRPGGRVWLGFEAAGWDVVLSVDDDGPGVEEDAKEAIFDPYVRVPQSSSVTGTGMGLALVERFAGLLGGRAWVEDRPGGGASFKVLLPGRFAESLSAKE